MITKMKKLTFLIYHKDYECFLQSVRDLGVVHVAEKAQGTRRMPNFKRASVCPTTMLRLLSFCKVLMLNCKNRREM